MCKFSPAFYDHIDILRIAFHQVGFAFGHFARHQRRTRTAEAIQYALTRLAAVADRHLDQLHRLLCGMHIGTGRAPAATEHIRLRGVTVPSAWAVQDQLILGPIVGKAQTDGLLVPHDTGFGG